MIYNGQVFSEDYEILQGAEVTDVSSGHTERTDGSGRFVINVAGMGSQLRISMFGYATQTTTPTQLEKNNGLALLLPAVNVQASAPQGKSDNTIWIVLAAVAATALAGKFLMGNANKPKTVKA